MQAMKRPLTLLTLLTVLIMPAVAQAQLKVGVVDMERAIVGTIEGKKAEAKFTQKLEEYRKSVEARQKELEGQQTKLRTQERLLSDQMKADLTKDIERRTTDLQRIQEDAQKDLDSLRGELMRPIAQVAEIILNVFAREQGFTLIIDTSNPENTSIVFVHPSAEVTDEITRRIDAEMAKAPPAPATPPATAPAKKPGPQRN